jgi:hypothetical protein
MRSSAVVIALVCSSCVIFQRPLEVPEGDAAAIVMASTAMPEPIENIARHAWFAVKEKGSDKWHRIEVGGFGRHPLAGLSDVRVHGVWTGKKAEKAIKCLRKHARAAHPRGDYLPWPGPNSNTFVDRLARKCKLHADLPATAIGKDYRGLIGVSWTAGGTGFQFETPLVGFKLGLTEGIELHLFGLAFGIDWWPPAIIVPIGSGRIGFDDR